MKLGLISKYISANIAKYILLPQHIENYGFNDRFLCVCGAFKTGSECRKNYAKRIQKRAVAAGVEKR